jgi:enediyne biosynthesis protein E5
VTATTTPAPTAPPVPAPRKPDPRIKALRRFALSITVFNVLGHTVLGFEQARITPVLAALTSYTAALLFETIDAWATGRRPEYARDRDGVLNFLLPAHIVGLASGMLLYANDSPWPYMFAIVVANASKYVVRVKVRGRTKHVLNPSNLGVAVTLLLFPWVGAAMPYQFTNLITGPFDWLLPAVVLVMGTLLNAKLTKKEPLILAWVAGVVAQAVLRHVLFGHSLAGALIPLTGVSFILFSNYMITDPGTTPFPWRRQVVFGLSVAFLYGLLVVLGVSFGFFFALTGVCALRGVCLWAGPRLSRGRAARGTADGAGAEVSRPAAGRPAPGSPTSR